VSIRALSILRDMVEGARKLLAAERGFNGKVIIQPYPIAEHMGEEDCCNGLLMGVIERLYVSSSFPVEDTLTNPCGAGILVADAVLTVATCSPKGNRTGYVSPDDLLQASINVWTDAGVAWRGARCVLLAADADLDWGFRDQFARPPEEGCIGSDLRVTYSYGLTGCDDCG
jgi:hypothetical protein